MARPEFAVTDEMRERVAIAAGSGQMTHEEIATAIGCSRPTLEKHFEAELSEGAYARRLDVVNAMHAAAMKGNVTAQRAYLEMEPRASAPPEKPEGEKPRGKKEQANLDAKTAAENTDWKDLLRPSASPPNALQ